MPLTFGISTFQVWPFSEMAANWRRIEDMGWDSAWLADHLTLANETPWTDGWSQLAGLAVTTSRLRIGVLVSSLVSRHPAAIAHAAITVDEMSGGRLELALGATGEEVDFAVAGLEPWSGRERVERMAQAITVIKALLGARTSNGMGNVIDGAAATRTSNITEYYTTREEPLRPGPVQKPHPPLTVAAHGPRALEVAARHADRWNSLGSRGTATRMNITLQQAVAETRVMSEQLDEALMHIGREPASITRSVLNFPPRAYNVFDSVAAFEEFVGAYSEIGISDFIVTWPGQGLAGSDNQRQRWLSVMEEVAADVLPRLRAADRG